MTNKDLNLKKIIILANNFQKLSTSQKFNKLAVEVGYDGEIPKISDPRITQSIKEELKNLSEEQKEVIKDMVQNLVNFAGIIPHPLAKVAEIINAAVYLMRGKKVQAMFTLLSLIFPIEQFFTLRNGIPLIKSNDLYSQVRIFLIKNRSEITFYMAKIAGIQLWNKLQDVKFEDLARYLAQENYNLADFASGKL